MADTWIFAFLIESSFLRMVSRKIFEVSGRSGECPELTADGVRGALASAHGYPFMVSLLPLPISREDGPYRVVRFNKTGMNVWSCRYGEVIWYEVMRSCGFISRPGMVITEGAWGEIGNFMTNVSRLKHAEMGREG